MSVTHQLEKMKMSSDKFLDIVAEQKEIRIWAYDLKQMAKEQRRCIETLELIMSIRAFSFAELQEISKKLAGVEVLK